MLTHLPHGPSMRFVSRIVSVEPGLRVVAQWDVPEQAFWTSDHFPGRPMLPGVLIVESMAQVCALVGLSGHDDPSTVGLPVLVGIDKARIRDVIRPGTQVTLEASCLSERRGLYRFGAHASVEGQQVASAEILAMAVR